MLKKLRKQVCNANKQLHKLGLVTLTWGNASGICRESGLVIIKPSGVPYKHLTPDDMVIVDMDGTKVAGQGKPSSDTATHLCLYKAFPNIGGIVHTHSTWATIFAQAGKSIPAYGTTHADYFYGTIPCTRALSGEEIAAEYALSTGNVIAEAFEQLDPAAMPGALVKNHGPFTWGTTPIEAVEHAHILEQIAHMAYHTQKLSAKTPHLAQALLDKHYFRKHGDGAYYGQK